VFEALIIQHENRMPRTALTSLACLAVPYCFNYLINGAIFGKKVTEHEMFVLISSTNLSEIFLILRIIERGSIINVHKSSCKLAVIFVRF
jgi:hypothetical protein